MHPHFSGCSLRKPMALVLVGLFAAFSAPRPAQATVTRVYTLGGMNRFILDDANRFIYPHAISRYSNLFYVDLFGAQPSRSFSAPGSRRQLANQVTTGGNRLSGQFSPMLQAFDSADMVPVQFSAGGGALFEVFGGLSLGLHLSDHQTNVVPRFLELLSSASASDPRNPGFVEPGRVQGTSNRKLDVFAAYELENLARLGLLISYGDSSFTRTPFEGEEGPPDQNGEPTQRLRDAFGSSEFGFVVSGELTVSEALAIEAGVGMNFHGLTYRPNNFSDLLDGGGGLEFRADARARLKLSKEWELVPAVSFRTLNVSGSNLGNYNTLLPFEGEDLREVINVAFGETLIDVGVAAHLSPVERIDFWVAVGFQHFDYFEELAANEPSSGPPTDLFRFRDTLLALPYLRLAIEARVFDWLDFRAGLVKFVQDFSTTRRAENSGDPSLEESRSQDAPFFDYFLGLKAHHEGFFLDFQVNPSFFRSGPDFLSGAGGNDLFVNASLGYTF